MSNPFAVVNRDDVDALTTQLSELFADSEACPLEAIAAMCRQITAAAAAVPGLDPDTILDWAAQLLDNGG